MKDRYPGRGVVASVAAVSALLLSGCISKSDRDPAPTQSLSRSSVVGGDCSADAIMRCGAPNRSAFIDRVKASAELQKVYAHFGLSPTDYGRFVMLAKPGIAYAENNTIVLDGEVVATNALAIGRLASAQGPGFMTVKFDGMTFYGNYLNKAAADAHAGLPVDVLLNDRGNMQFAVFPDSGDPLRGNEVVASIGR